SKCVNEDYVQEKICKITQLKEDLISGVDQEEKKLEGFVKALESKLGTQAPNQLKPHEKLAWLTSELKKRDSQEQVEIVKSLGERFRDKQVPALKNLKEEVVNDIKNKKNNGSIKSEAEHESLLRRLAYIDIDGKSGSQILNDATPDQASPTDPTKLSKKKNLGIVA
ncbi:MAG: hypothetical protein RLZZ361_1614, partial [Cyanobacteriota bacterium]